MRLISITEEAYVDFFSNTVFLNALFLQGVEEWEGFQKAVESYKSYIESEQFEEDVTKEMIEVKKINE